MLVNMNCYFQSLNHFTNKDGKSFWNLAVITDDDRLVGLISDDVAMKIKDLNLKIFTPVTAVLDVHSGVNSSGYQVINARLSDLFVSK